MRTWNEMNVLKWIKNQEVAHTRKMLKKKVERKLAREKQATIKRVRDRDIQEVRTGLVEWEKNIPIEEPQVEELPVQRSQEDGFVQAMRVIKRKKKEGKVLEALRDSRRRKFMVEDEEAQVSQGDGDAIKVQEQLLRPCQADRDLGATLDHIARHKAMFADNRSYRNQQYQLRKEEDQAQLVVTHQSYLSTVEETYRMDMVGQHDRAVLAIEARSSAYRTRVEEYCKATVDRMVDLSCEVVATRAFLDYGEGTTEDPDTQLPGAPLPASLWRDMKEVFLSSLPLLKGDAASADEEEEGQTTLLDDANMAIYLEPAWPWVNPSAVTTTTPAQPTTPPPTTTTGHIVTDTPQEQALGEVLIEISLAAEPLPALPPPPSIPRFSISVALVGKSFSGKTIAAKRMADLYSLKVSEANEMSSGSSPCIAQSGM